MLIFFSFTFQTREKILPNSVKLAYIAELLSTIVEEAKQYQKAPMGQGSQRLDNRTVE